MTDFNATSGPIDSIVAQVRDLQLTAAQQYKPVVDELVRTRSRDVWQIEHTLDGLLDFCGYEPVMQMFKQLCRHYWEIDPAATAEYVNAYREYWDNDGRGAPT